MAFGGRTDVAVVAEMVGPAAFAAMNNSCQVCVLMDRREFA